MKNEIIISAVALVLIWLTYYIMSTKCEKCETTVSSLNIQLEELKRNNDYIVDTIRKQLFEKEKVIDNLANIAKKLKPKYENIKNTKYTKSDTALLESLYRAIQHPIER